MGLMIKPDRWLSIAEAAELAQEPTWKLKRKLLALHETTGGRVLQSYQKPGKKVRKWFVSAEALLVCLRTDPKVVDAQIEAIESRLGVLESRQVALRNAHRQHRREQSDRWKKQEAVNSAVRKAISATNELLCLLPVEHR
jgi:hypothetical protein